MPETAIDHIAERTDEAGLYLKDRNPVGRAVGGAGLTVSNGIDRVVSIAKSPRLMFLGGMGLGAWRGVYFGAIAALFVAALAPAMGITALFAFAGAGAVYFAMRDGQRTLDRATLQPNSKVADTIAKTSGAVPQKETSLLPKVTAPMYEDPAIERQVNFAQQERQRRIAQAARVNTP